MMDAEDKVSGIPTKSRVSSQFRSKREGYRQDLVNNEDEFHVRPPSGTNHQHPGKHLSIDNRFSELSLDESSWVAESERRSPNVPRITTKEQHRKKIRQDKVQMPKANFYVTSPFKQGSETYKRGPVMVVDPSHDLKQRTLAGVARIKKQLNHESKRYKQFSRPPSHIQRGYSNPGGNLRPLGRPVTASGPLMRNCQGIIAGARSHRSFSRQADSGFQRTCSSARPASPTELLRPESSIHNTSCASSITDEFGKDDGESFSEDERQDGVEAVHDTSSERKGFMILKL